jgi:hypothetical protein
MTDVNASTIYDITVQGQLRQRWMQWLDGSAVQIESADDTTIRVRVPDQAALRGVLNKLWDLNLTLISIVIQNDETNNRSTI